MDEGDKRIGVASFFHYRLVAWKKAREEQEEREKKKNHRWDKKLKRKEE